MTVSVVWRHSAGLRGVLPVSPKPSRSQTWWSDERCLYGRYVVGRLLVAGKKSKSREVLKDARRKVRRKTKDPLTGPPAAQQLLLAITRAQSLFIDEVQPAVLYGVLLQELLMLTQSEYGFISEVAGIAEGQPFINTHAVTNIGWNEETKALMAQKTSTREFSNFQTLFRHAMTTGEPVISNDPAHDPRAGGLPPGHPPMHALLGLPLYRGEVIVGMVGLANRPGGYDESLITYLEPFLSICAQLLDGYRNRRLRAEAEAGLRSSEERWQLAVQGSYDGIWDWDLVGNQVYFSPRWKEILGHEDHEILNDYQEWESRLHPEDREHVISQLTDYLERRSLRYQVEFRLRKKNGEYCWMQARGKAVWDAEGRPSRMAGSHTDITERKREEALQVAEKQTLELVAEGSSLGEVLTFLCRAIEDHTGPMLSSIMLVTDDGSHLSSAAGPSLSNEYSRLIDRIPIGPTVGSCGSAAYYKQPAIVCDIATDPLWKGYADVAMTHGLKACWSQPILNSSGILLGTFAAYFREPTKPQPRDLRLIERAGHIAALAIEHARTLGALKESEERFRLMFMNEPECVKTVTPEGVLLAMNPTGLRMIEADSPEEVVGRSVLSLIHSEDRSAFWEAHCAAANGSASALQFRVIGLKGQLRWMDTHSVPLRDAGGTITAVLSVTRDVTERKRLEQASQDQADRLRLAMDIAGLAIWDWNILTNQIIWSDNCEQVKRLPAGSFEGTFEAYQRLVHPEDLPRLQADIEGAFSGQKPYHTEHRLVPPSGEVQWIESNGVVYRDELGRP
ncbi:MAG: PAS domain-containing protein, partial [Nitrospirae bacterium]|nr:PAS domain-containing protein [Nitrospirota bacterium]